MTTEQLEPIGGAGCLCRDLIPADRPCLTCQARASIATTPVEPAFPLRSATVWSVVLTYKIARESLARQVLIMSADPSGADLARIAMARVEGDAPGATDMRVVRVELIGDAYGTAVVPAGGAS